ncbi:MAG: tRNA ((7)-)-methyltransferase [Betaproteobacteria bacterium]|nr:tRNA ((7)-)-methyltransferase [Betaproteobacteria bacterium]
MNTLHRPIRSFVLRQGRVSNAQQRAHSTLLPKFGIEYSPHFVDLDAIFGRAAPKVLEIGFGMGETTAIIAAQHPENDYLGIEVHTPGVGSLLKAIEEQNLANVRIVQHDAVEVLCYMVPPLTFAAVHIFFPDPWPKKRHHKRRLLQPPLVALLVERMKPGAYLHVATDWQEYAEYVLSVLQNNPQLENTAHDYAPRPDYRPQTKFESRGLKLGHGVWDLIFKRL